MRGQELDIIGQELDIRGQELDIIGQELNVKQNELKNGVCASEKKLNGFKNWHFKLYFQHQLQFSFFCKIFTPRIQTSSDPSDGDVGGDRRVVCGGELLDSEPAAQILKHGHRKILNSQEELGLPLLGLDAVGRCEPLAWDVNHRHLCVILQTNMGSEKK